ncbi:hypothetical protein EVAR_11045_1 [Eumeta japonica]|uniref:Uncharacterized protein n=1 Tax=Eumeta variegata TaxID=151549 RepID=A0A4C1U4W6_EUMVA|nr:hypothetical protein EVAR_11045_1 [Eumeta japonica]
MKLHATISNTKSRQSWKTKMHEIMENPEKRVEFLSFAEKAFREATSRHRSMNRKRNEETPPTAPTSAPTQKPQENPENEATTLRTTTTERMLRCAETAGKPGIRTRGVALFMDENTERLGIGFEAHGKEQRFTFARTCQPHKRQYQ